MSVPFAIDWRRLLASPEFRARLIFTLGALLLFRLARFIPMPGIDSRALTQVLSGSKLLSAGDQTVRFSIVAL